MSDDHEFVVCNLIYLKAINAGAGDLDFAMKLKTYFCILRHTVQSTVASFEANGSLYSCVIAAHSMLASYLSDLGKLSHLISLDYIWFLMICSTAPKHFGCWVVTFKVQMSNLDALNVDLQDYVVQRYNHVLEFMPEIDHDESSVEILKVILCDGSGRTNHHRHYQYHVLRPRAVALPPVTRQETVTFDLLTLWEGRDHVRRLLAPEFTSVKIDADNAWYVIMAEKIIRCALEISGWTLNNGFNCKVLSLDSVIETSILVSENTLKFLMRRRALVESAVEFERNNHKMVLVKSRRLRRC
ncbi:hypothetical protein V6N13_126161 [Hibiscus sabdariffa]